MRSGGVRLMSLAAALAVALVLVGIRTSALAESDPRSTILLIPAFVLGLWPPPLALIYAVSSRRAAVIVLAFSTGLSVNVVLATVPS